MLDELKKHMVSGITVCHYFLKTGSEVWHHVYHSYPGPAFLILGMLRYVFFCFVLFLNV